MTPKNRAGNTLDRSAGAPPALSGPAPMWATLVATFFGIGRARPGPGTWASAATVLLWWFLAQRLNTQWQTVMACLLAGLTVAVGIPAATQVSRAAALKDPQFVVIDEVAGQLITFIAVPAAWKSLLLGFILFRGFDIVKPPPLRHLEKLREGTGIMLDDVGAALYASICMHIALHFGLLK
jgi:phosphatidylglycerophosphatase A